MALPSGEVIHAGIDLDMLDQSVHGMGAAAPVYCTDCHGPRQRYQYPHGENPAQDMAEYQDEVSQNCEQCHTSALLHNPGHLQADDISNLPNCVDCHGGHNVAPVAAMQADPVGTCQQCHQEFEDPVIADVHAELVTNFGPGQSCETCHASTPQSEDAMCQTCHSLLSSELTLSPGESVSLHVDPQDIVNSVHGEQVFQGIQYTTLRCTDCHQEQGLWGFPHQEIDADTRRDLTISMQQVCQDCHLDVYERNADGVHAQHIVDGQLQAATCSDCHGNHAIQDPNSPREHVSQICANCHADINEQYVMSVHGAALLGEDNPDVPVCTDCHGVHDITDPTTAAFRLSSPNMCGECHADVDLMNKYNISTDIFDTYVADFHGTTVTLFEHQSPDEETNKAVCYDCHGVHNILPATDENSQIIKANLLVTCQQCHPDANENFPDSWTSHYKPSLEHNPLVYFVDLFYMIVIPATVGGFMLFIGSDIFRRVRERFQRKPEEVGDE
ncbi:MAG: cytochrome c3 family protein [Caldilinea sp.]